VENGRRNQSFQNDEYALAAGYRQAGRAPLTI
jgi:hypothetical protein